MTIKTVWSVVWDGAVQATCDDYDAAEGFLQGNVPAGAEDIMIHEHFDDVDALESIADFERREDCQERLNDFLDGVEKWVCEYSTENDDYASGYDCLVTEDPIRWRDRLYSWLDDNRPGLTDSVKERIWMDLSDGYDFEWHYQSNEYAAWSGKGFCIDSFDIGECEEQLSIADHPILQEFHDLGILDDLLDDYNGDLYISRSKRRVKNESTGRYEEVGRETYISEHGYHAFYGYAVPGGAWHAVVDEEVMQDVISRCVITECEKLDG